MMTKPGDRQAVAREGGPGHCLGVMTAIFFLSGFSGLIYESLWTHYLKLFLGHAAFAQTLVLAIFMGGLAVGSWISARVSPRLAAPLRAYALVEAAIALLALLFHPLYAGITGWAFESVLPALGGGWAGPAVKWSLAGLLILPQSVLLGMTFPFMTAAALRRGPGQAGRVVAGLYFINSLGGVVGVLASGFVLVAWLGLPGTMGLAGGLNLLVAAVAWSLARPGDAAPAKASRPGRADWGLLAVAFLTGATSFAYEIGWIRLLSMALGASTHSFEVMLAAFILGIALGGLVIRRRIDRLVQPLIALALAQLAMGVLAASTLVSYSQVFYAMRWLMRVLERSEAGYLLYNLSGLGLSLAVMLPATICAGMTLPLITVALLRRGGGEAAVGTVYGANTLGAIAGVVFSLHVGLPMLGLEGLLLGAGVVDAVVGLVLLASLGAPLRRMLAGAAALSVAGLAGVAAAGAMDQSLLASGVYRKGRLIGDDGGVLLGHRHGKTASIHVTRNPDGIVTIRTNGKADASVAMADTPPQSDETTMLLVGALPLLLRPEARNAAAIGFGSGLSTHALLAAPGLEAVDTIEIEPAMVEMARAFLPHNRRAYDDRRSRIHYDDAKSFFASRGRWDVITSEPSNPWVSGVAGLFSAEFYGLARRHLAPGGILVQWMHLYEIDPPLVSTIFQALEREFPHYAVYGSNTGDILIAASADGPVGAPGPEAFAPLAAELSRFRLDHPDQVAMRRLGDQASLHPLFVSYGLAANSDYRPVLDQGAAKARFLGRSTEALVNLRAEPLPVLEMLSEPGAMVPPVTVAPTPFFSPAFTFHRARMIQERLQGGLRMDDPWTREFGRDADRLAGLCLRPDIPPVIAMIELAKATLAYLPKAEAEALWDRVGGLPCAAGAAAGWYELFGAVAARDAAAMAARAEALLGSVGEPTQRRFLIAAALLGRIAHGEPGRAAELWRGRSAEITAAGERGLLFALLRAHAGLPQ